MTQHKSKKRLVRERMAKTGESYQAAERAVTSAEIRDPAPSPVADAALPTWALQHGNERYVMTEVPFVVGRTSDCRLILLEDALVSRKHATFAVAAGRLRVEDHESRNGVLVNSKRIAGRADLLGGDVVVIGNALLTVVKDGSVPAASRAKDAPRAKGVQLPPSVEEILDNRFRVGRLMTPNAGPLSGAPSPPFPWVEIEAEHKLLGGEITIKLLPGSIARLQRNFRDMLLHEGRALRRATHAGVQKVFDVGETGAGGIYLVLERLPARTLDRVVEAGAITPELTLHVIRELAAILAHVHAKGVVHRDLRNGVIHVGDGPRPEVKLGSFSLATIAGEPTPPAPRAIVPRPSAVWTAPERLRGEDWDARSDLYGLGVVLATMLTGRLPEPPEPPHGDHGDQGDRGPLDAVCGKLLARDPSARYGSALELLHELPALS